MSQYEFLPYIAGLIQAAKEADAPPLDTLTPAEARAARNPIITQNLGPPEDVAKVDNLSIPGPGGDLALRVYTPEGEGPFGALVYFHGGGWVVGTLDTHDSLCRKLANRAGCVVVAVDYRLSPEAKFPAAMEDAYAGVKWVHDNAASIEVDPDRLAVGGDSCGGGMAASVCLMAKQRGGPALKFQLVVYPVSDLSSFDKESYRKYGNDLMLTRDGMAYFRDSFLASPDAAGDPIASPLLADDLSGLPPALVITAEHDVLTSEGELLARRLDQAGVPTVYSCYPGVIHLFFGMDELSEDENGLAQAGAALREALA